MIKFLDLNKQYQSIKEEIDHAIKNVINDSAYIGGKYVEEFENSFAQYIDVKNCVGVGNGTDALEISIEALDLPKGSEIIVPANSYIASSEAVTRTGHKVIFADVCKDTYVLSLEDTKKRINSKTAAIIAVHLYGHPCDMDGLLRMAKKNNLKIIEDCAQAHGSKYKGISIGGIGDIAAFSFYPGKNLGAYGDGGAIVTNNDHLAKKSRMIANHGRVKKYDHLFEGRNSRLDGLQAAVLSAKLRHLESWISKKIEIANLYLQELAEIGDLILPKRMNWAKQAYHLFVIRSNYRDELKSFLDERGIQTGIHYPTALPKMPAYQHLENKFDGKFSILSDSTLLSLPIGEHLDIKEVFQVIQEINKFFKKI